jgi:type VI secretion system protein ImpG
MRKLDPFFDYYQRELNYLRYAGAQFARKYPKIARRLDLTGTQSADPHVERLLESFAYLTARLQRDIDDQFPRFSEALLGVLYPQFVHPIPSCTIARFEANTQGGKATSHTRIDRHMPLFTRTNDGTVCHFRTVYPVELLPITISRVEVVFGSSHERLPVVLQSSQLLRIHMKSLAGTFAEMNLSRLRFYIAGNRLVKTTLLESLLTAQMPLVIEHHTSDMAQVIPPSALRHVGFAEGEEVLPWPVQAHPAYRLLFEYFHFPEKFFFIEIEDRALAMDTSDMVLLLPLHPRTPINPKDVGTNNIVLGCTPIVNLFPKTTEPLVLTHRSYEYRLVADQRLENSTEIYAIQEVIAAFDGQNKTETYMPYFSYNHYQHKNQQKMFWIARRTAVNRLDFGGTDVFLSFVDFAFNPAMPPEQTLYAKVLCTNRSLATHIPPGSVFYPEGTAAVQRITCLDRPSPQGYPVMDGERQWRLISHLCLNHLALSGGQAAVETLKEILYLYAEFGDAQVIPEIHALQEITLQSITRRFRKEAWRGFAQGTKITLTFETAEMMEGSVFMLASILNHFFALMASVNSFTELEVHRSSQEGVWFKWPPLIGKKVLL